MSQSGRRIAPPADPPSRQRLDRWLWAARFFKTRALAVRAVEAGRVEVDGEPVRRARLIGPGTRIRLRLGPYEHLLLVTGLSERRGPAAVAATLYQEDPEGRRRRRELAEQHRLARAGFAPGEGKPTRQQRRQLRRLKGDD